MIRTVFGDITKIDYVEAIVNAANTRLKFCEIKIAETLQFSGRGVIIKRLSKGECVIFHVISIS